MARGRRRPGSLTNEETGVGGANGVAARGHDGRVAWYREGAVGEEERECEDGAARSPLRLLALASSPSTRDGGGRRRTAALVGVRQWRGGGEASEKREKDGEGSGFIGSRRGFVWKELARAVKGSGATRRKRPRRRQWLGEKAKKKRKREACSKPIREKEVEGERVREGALSPGFGSTRAE